MGIHYYHCNAADLLYHRNAQDLNIGPGNHRTEIGLPKVFGDSMVLLTDLLGSTGMSDLILYMHNYGSFSTQTSFNGAFDNFRVVKR